MIKREWTFDKNIKGHFLFLQLLYFLVFEQQKNSSMLSDSLDNWINLVVENSFGV